MEQNNNKTKKIYKGISKYIHGTYANKIRIISNIISVLHNNNKIITEVNKFSINKDKIDMFAKSYHDTMEFYALSSQKESNSKGIIKQFNKLMAAAKEDYASAVKIARLALKKDPVKLAELGICGAARRDYAGIFNSMQTFYDNTLASKEILQAMSVYSYDADKLNELRAGFIKTRETHNEYLKAEAQSRAATQTRKQKIAELDQFVLELHTIAQVAFGKKSIELGMLGFD